MSDCLFCKIAAGAIPSDRVAETDRVLAFRDINPAAPTHVLLIPKDHVVDSAAQLTGEHSEMLGELFELAARIASALSLPVGQRAAMAESAQHHVAAHFSKTKLQRETLQVYDELLGSRLMAEFELKQMRNEALKSSASTIPASFV